MSCPPQIIVHPKPKYGIIVCTTHQYCLLPNSTFNHFSTKHNHHTTVEQRREIQAFVLQIQHQVHSDISQIELLTDPQPVISGLKVHCDSLKCNACGHIHAGASALDNMKAHLRSHEIYATTSSTRGTKQTAEWWSSHWTSVFSQQFFVSANRKNQQATSHFEVYYLPTQSPLAGSDTKITEQVMPGLPPNTNVSHEPHSPAISIIDRLQAQFKEAEVLAEKDAEALSALVPLAPDRQTNPYLEHTQFQRCIEGLSWESVREYTTPTVKSQLAYLQDTVKSTVIVYQHTVAATSRWIRIRVMQETLQHIPLSPLVHYQAFDNRHSNVLVKIFTFFYQINVEGFERPATLSVSSMQQHAWNAIQDHLDKCGNQYPKVSLKHNRTELTLFEQLCHRFWLSLLEQTGIADDFQLAVVTPLAFIAVDANKDQFRAAYNFATDLSAIKKLARFAGCQKVREEAAQYGLVNVQASTNAQNDTVLSENNTSFQPDVELHEATELIREQEESLAEHSRQEGVFRAANDEFKHWVYQYLTTEYATPISWVITTAQYISRFRYGETLDAFVRWNGDTVTVRHISTTFDKFTSMVWAIFHKAEGILTQLTYVVKLDELPEIPWEKLQCDPSNTETGYSPFSPKRGPLQHGRHFVRQSMIHAIVAKQHKSTTVQSLDNIEQIKRYGDLVQEYLGLLFLVIHFSSGQPGRLTEVTSIQIENTVSNGIRNLFMFEGYVALVPRYHKGYNRDKTLKMIYRFLPREVGRLLVWYIWLVRPFYTVLTQQETKEHRTPHYFRARSALLWSDYQGEQWKNSVSFGELMKRQTQLYIGEPIGPSIMRHLLVTFGRKQDAHKNNRLQKLDPDEVDDVMEEINSEAREMQAGHTPNTATAIYAVETASVFRHRFTAPQAHLKVSSRWHQGLGFDPNPDLQEEADSRETVRSLLAERIAKRGYVNVKRVLQENFGKSAAFRGQQRAVVENVVEGEPAVSYIASTGSGKSLSFLLPACCPGYGQTIVVTPLVALRDDISSRCKELSLTTSLFDGKQFNESARIILAMPENLKDDRFTKMVDRRRDMGYVERIVVDEFHYVLLPDHEYRPLLLKMRDVARYAIPVTFLSATIPVEEEEEAYRLLGFQGRVRTFREPTTRTNLRYEVETLPQKTKVSIRDMAKYVTQQHRHYCKVLVYVAYTSIVKALSEEVGGAAYHGGLSEKERSEVQHTYRQTQSGILVATTAFNAGVDVRDIRLVLRFGKPDHPITWAQESGRGGRDGLPCVARIVLGPGIPSFINQLEPRARKVLEQFMQTDVKQRACMRTPLDLYFDGNAKRTGCRQEEEMCSFCQRQASTSNTTLVENSRSPLSAQAESILWTPVTDRNFQVHDTTPQSDMVLQTPETVGYLASSPLQLTASRAFGHPQGSLPSTSRWPSQGQVGRQGTGPPHFSTGSPTKRQRDQSSGPGSSPSSTPVTARTHIKAARIERSLEYNQEQWREKGKSSIAFDEQLHRTARMWTDNCVRCFVDQEPFNHPKATCTMFTQDIVAQYKNELMQRKFGRPLCWSCMMPLTLCEKWYDSDSKRLRREMIRAPCTYPFVIGPVWACLLEYCPIAKQIWWDRIRAESKGKYDPDNAKELAAYFREMIHTDSEKPVGRIAYDVNWITHEYFLHSEEGKWKELWGGAK